MKTAIQGQIALEEIEIPGYERIVKIDDKNSGLKALIAIHDLTLGPALGGTRIFPYANWDDALYDVLRLSKGMTYKAAVSGLGLGGGKSVIFADPKHHITPDQLRAFGIAVNQLEGAYICAEDVGCTEDHLKYVRETTDYVVGLAHPKSSGNPSPFTAYGVFRGIQAVAQHAYGSDSLLGKTIAIQGLGAVGEALADRLYWAGARLILCDQNQAKAEYLAQKYAAKFVSPDEILSVKCDILAPCALGGILNSSSIAKLNCRAVAGAANNQLQSDNHAIDLMQCGIIYAPDFLINSGGLINVSFEVDYEGYNPVLARDKIDTIYEQLLTIFDISKENKCSTHQAAVELASYRLRYGVGKRTTPLIFHHD
ncbi:MAG: Glu/Leu/Phe/Val dehydrogenase [Chlamydiia bacterium]|nr:Glu/Leu/Phe/Val dehydrogenase [Chlamydiia bacterium]MCP5509358.1 Glu/Leu/Phe/Val dehydrogenase [Chlamydiales bacterium]